MIRQSFIGDSSVRFKAFYIAVGVLFLLFSTNAYACLLSMAPSTAMSMPMDDPMPSQDDAPKPCETLQCDTMTPQNRAVGDCLLPSTVSALNALKIAQPDLSAPALTLNFITAAAPLDASGTWRADDSPRPLYSVSLLLLHSTLLL